MRTQKFGKPEVNFSWFLRKDDYANERNLVTLDTDEGKKQLAEIILICISQGKEVRIGTDGECLMLEANDADCEYSSASYQYVDDDCDVIKNIKLPDDTYVHVYSDEEANEELNNWLKENPGWTQNEWGTWMPPRVEANSEDK